MRVFGQGIRLYRDRRLLNILCLGFSSGLPFLLTLATLHVWLSEAGATKTTIGLFVLVTLPYTLKFLWAPLVDHCTLPFLTKTLGKRRAWLLVSQTLLIMALLLLGSTDPHTHIMQTALAGVFVAFCSATQDIVFEAYRVEILKPTELGAGASASMLGYRLGLWAAGAGSLYIASYYSWFAAYTVMALCVSVGILATLWGLEPELKNQPSIHLTPFSSHRSLKLFASLQRSFLSFRQRENWAIILLYIFFYKIGDTTLNVMTAPFLLEAGFSKVEIAEVAKLFGIGAVILGGFIGSLTLMRKPLIETLVLCALLQFVSCLLFALQAYVGYNLGLLYVTVAVENLTCGMGTAAFITYLSNLCQMPHTATHYALLSSIGSLARVGLSFLAGVSADHLPWIDFYLITAVACIPCLLLLINKPDCFRFHHASLLPSDQTLSHVATSSQRAS